MQDSIHRNSNSLFNNVLIINQMFTFCAILRFQMTILGFNYGLLLQAWFWFCAGKFILYPYADTIEVDIYNTLEGALFESTGSTILWALCSMLEAGRSQNGGNGLK